MEANISHPKAIIGLGNPGAQYARTRHNIGFMVLDALASKYNGDWQEKTDSEVAKIIINGASVLLVKPQTFMNDSGRVVLMLKKQGINAGDTLVVHDELEKPFGKIAIRMGGSARGHNGLKSLIAAWGESFGRLRFGISRPAEQESVSQYVLENFRESNEEIERLIAQSIAAMEALYS